jgi:CDP-glycerol glycerophosphotransferase (TagB/SpsB family)
VTTCETPAIRDNHRLIVELIEDAARRDRSAGHQALLGGDILAVFPRCDAMVTDVSSVGLDWLYLQTDKPILITDRHHDADRLRLEVPVSRCADVVDSSNLDDLTALVTDRLALDTHHLARVAMRHHYFDDNAVGDSTRRFVEAIAELAVRRDGLLGDLGLLGDAASVIA